MYKIEEKDIQDNTLLSCEKIAHSGIVGYTSSDWKASNFFFWQKDENPITSLREIKLFSDKDITIIGIDIPKITHPEEIPVLEDNDFETE